VYYLYIVTALAIIASLIFSREKTLAALKLAVKRLTGILPTFLVMLIFISVIVGLVPDEVISTSLANENTAYAFLLAVGLGSVTLLPGFIAFPLAGILLQKGVSYMVLAAFTTSMMMVGVLTYPLERAFFGARVTVIRNAAGLIMALIVSLVIGIYFGEVF